MPEIDTPTSRYAVAPDGTRLAVQVGVAPGGEGPPLLLLAGQSNSHHWWDGIRDGFGERTTITLDWRGTGDSDAPDERCSTQGFAADVAAVVEMLRRDLSEVLGDGPLDVYGTSMGGRVAQWLAATRPDLVRRLVLGCTTPGGPHAVERSADLRRALADRDPVRARAALVDVMVTPGRVATHGEPVTVLGDPGMTAYARGRHLTASARHDAWDVLPRITAPTLVVHGADDLMAPVANAALLAQRIPDARTHVVAGARHAYFLEFHDEASAVVRAFLT